MHETTLQDNRLQILNWGFSRINLMLHGKIKSNVSYVYDVILSATKKLDEIEAIYAESEETVAPLYNPTRKLCGILARREKRKRKETAGSKRPYGTPLLLL